MDMVLPALYGHIQMSDGNSTWEPRLERCEKFDLTEKRRACQSVRGVSVPQNWQYACQLISSHRALLVLFTVNIVLHLDLKNGENWLLSNVTRGASLHL